MTIPLWPRTPLHGVVAVNTTAVHLAATFPRSAPGGWLIVPMGSATVYLGGSGVTTANGLPLIAGTAVGLETTSLDGWYVIAGSSTEVRVLGLEGGV